MLKQLIIVCLFATLYSCKEQNDKAVPEIFNTKQNQSDAPKTLSAERNCGDIPKAFRSYQQAKDIIEKSTFLYSDKVNTGKSSWIRAANFYSCDHKNGFFIIATDKQEYIHQDLPIEAWNSFKSANSFGQFYNQHIKKRYQLKVQP